MTDERDPGAIFANTRELETDIVTDFSQQLSYGEYLALDDVLNAQHLRSTPAHHDEMLFIIQHQTSELWLKLMIHELRSARAALQRDDLGTAVKRIARGKHIQVSMTEQWSVLATLTPSEYVEFRHFLATSSGFQSYQYRAVEFLLSNKNAKLLEVFAREPAANAILEQLLEESTLYDEFLHFLSRAGFPVPPAVLERDVTLAHVFTPELVPVFVTTYRSSTDKWRVYEACEEFVDLEDNFQLWRFRHLRTVSRTIGMKNDTGGSTGVQFFERALSLIFFPELFAVRNEIGA